MKILILSCNTGGGHNAAARALKAEFVRRGYSCDIKDALDFAPRIKKDFTEAGHSAMYRWAPNLYGRLYDKIEKMKKHTGIYLDYARFAPLASVCMYEGKYDAAICVHAFPAFMLNAAKRLFNLQASLYFVATDYSVAPGLENTSLDAYFVPRACGERFRAKLPNANIVESGIPIDSKYYSELSKASARRELGIRDDVSLVLIEAGSIGCGPIKVISDKLSQELGDSACIAVLCGNNDKLRRELSQRTSDAHFLAIGFTDKVLLWTKAADVIISKAGGLSVTEISSAGVPLICMDAVPGLEQKNLDTMVEWGCALSSKRIDEIIELAKELCIDSNKRNAIIEAQSAIFRGNSVAEIADYVIKKQEDRESK